MRLGGGEPAEEDGHAATPPSGSRARRRGRSRARARSGRRPRARRRRACARSARPAGSCLGDEDGGVAGADERPVEGRQRPVEDDHRVDERLRRRAIGEAHGAARVPRSTRVKCRRRSSSPFSAEKLDSKRLAAEQLVQLAMVVAPVRDRDEAAAGPQHARELRERRVDVGHVEQHPGRERAVELPVLERQLPDVADDRVDAARPRQLDHPLRLVDADDDRVALARDPLGDVPAAAADLEHAARPGLDDRVDAERQRVRPLGTSDRRRRGPRAVPRSRSRSGRSRGRRASLRLEQLDRIAGRVVDYEPRPGRPVDPLSSRGQPPGRARQVVDGEHEPAPAARLGPLLLAPGAARAAQPEVEVLAPHDRDRPQSSRLLEAEPVDIEADGAVEIVDEVADDRHGSTQRSTNGWPGMPRFGALPPSHAFTVAPTSANSPSCRRPVAFLPSTYASSSACSREWSVDGVVGSTPWSEVRTSRSPSRSAASRSGSRRSKSWRRAVEVDRVVAVAPEHVRLDQVREDQALVDLLQQPLGRLDALDVRLRRMRLVDVLAGEDVADLADAVHAHAGVADQREVVRPLRLEREVVPVRRAHVVARLAGEGPRDHAPDGVLAGQDLARVPAALVQLLERDRVLVRGDLEDGVGRRVDDPLARALVLLAELLDDLGAGGGLVAEHAAARAVHERVDHVVREAVRVGRERLRRDDPHHLPVPRRGVLALRALDEPAGDRGRAGLRRAALQRLDVPEARAPRASAGRARRPPCARFPSVSEPSSP